MDKTKATITDARIDDVAVAKQSTTSVYDLGVDYDRFRRLGPGGPGAEEKAETLHAMELATRMG
jgi:hypothetical protein